MLCHDHICEKVLHISLFIYRNKLNEIQTVRYIDKMSDDSENNSHIKLSLNDRSYVNSEFVQNIFQERFSNIVMIFEDGNLEVNKAALASISENIYLTLEDHHDAVKIPGVKKNTFLSLLELCSMEKDHQILPVDILEMTKMLQINILHQFVQFKEKQKLKSKTFDTKGAENITITKDHKREEAEDKVPDHFSQGDITSYPDCVQIEVNSDTLELKTESSLDNIVCQWLQCQDCHQVIIYMQCTYLYLN